MTTPRFAKAYAEFKQRALATGVIQQPIRVSVNKAKTVARVDFPLAGNGHDATAVRALETLRTEVIPPVLATLPVEDASQAVTGETAADVRLQPDDEVARADRVRVRARAAPSCCCCSRSARS